MAPLSCSRIASKTIGDISIINIPSGKCIGVVFCPSLSIVVTQLSLDCVNLVAFLAFCTTLPPLSTHFLLTVACHSSPLQFHCMHHTLIHSLFHSELRLLFWDLLLLNVQWYIENYIFALLSGEHERKTRQRVSDALVRPEPCCLRY